MARITPKQHKFIAALIQADTTQAAIDEVGVSKNAAYRWLKDPDFMKELRQARRDVLFHATGTLTAATDSAVQTLAMIMKDKSQPATSRVQAARIILDTAFNALQADDLQERIEQLEQNTKRED